MAPSRNVLRALNEGSEWVDGQQAGYTFTRGLDYGAIVATSEKVAWTIDEIFGDRFFDPSGRIVPDSWTGTRGLGFLDEGEQIVLNHCRAFSYVHLLGNFEEFVPPHLDGVARRDWHCDRAHLRALWRFGEEELKHQQLFRRAETVLEESCGHPFGRHFDPQTLKLTEFTAAILDHPVLPRFLIVMALEWGTQRHYVESIRHQSRETADPLYVDILRAHWVEEAQHTKADILEIGRLAEEMSPEELCRAFDDLLAIANLVDAAFAGQAEKEIETLQTVVGRIFSSTETAVLRETLHHSLRRIFAETGLTHPGFARVALELSPAGAAKLGIV